MHILPKTNWHKKNLQLSWKTLMASCESPSSSKTPASSAAESASSGKKTKSTGSDSASSSKKSKMASSDSASSSLKSVKFGKHIWLLLELFILSKYKYRRHTTQYFQLQCIISNIYYFAVWCRDHRKGPKSIFSKVYPRRSCQTRYSLLASSVSYLLLVISQWK